MRVVNGILKEELDRLERLQAKYSAMLKALPKGSLRKKKIGQKIYFYLVSRKGDQVVTEYLCQGDSPEAKSFEEQDAKRRDIKSKFKSVKEDIAEIKKAIGKFARASTLQAKRHSRTHL
ncbi:MAG: hypothetical protein II819_10320 [Fibrobacter sp.]|nr:hypothetical protein [Fibrobacter sp.]